MELTTWRLLKFLSLVLLSAGVVGAATHEDRDARHRSAYLYATVGLMASMLTGYGLMKATGLTMRESWIGTGILLGVASAAGSWLAARGGMVGRLGAAVGVGALVLTLGVMSTHGVGAVPLVMAAVAALWAGSHAHPDAPDPDAVQRWFLWIARAEGVSLLVLFGLYMPLKYGMHIEIDGGQGWVGWVHGVMVMAYVPALIVSALTHRWSVVQVGLGFVASLLPFGTFWFERRISASDAS